MALSTNLLRQQVDLPVWEWMRPAPAAAAAGLSCTAATDSIIQFNQTTGRYIYKLINATSFWRYDTFADSYEQLANPGITVLTASSMRLASASGYNGRVYGNASTSTTLNTGIPYAGSAIGYRIRIISGKGAGQVRMITGASDPIVVDWGGASAGAATTLTDSAKNWGYTGTINNFNGFVGCVVRIVGGTGINQVRKILYNTNQVLTIADPSIYAYDVWCEPMGTAAGTAGWTAPAAGSLYQIDYATLTVDTAWDVIPDNTSRYVIEAGGIWLASGAAVASGNITLQYYSILEDVWYAKRSLTNMSPILLTDLSLEFKDEAATIWYTGQSSGTNTTTTMNDTRANWNVNQWTGYAAFVWSGTGRGQVGFISANTATALTFSNTLGTNLDATSKYNIIGYDAGTLTSTVGRVVTDTTKTWTIGQYNNYAIRIVFGTGMGQVRGIVATGTNSLVVNDIWNVQPDSTSVYEILPNMQDMAISVGGNAQLHLYRTGDVDMLTNGRIYDEGVVQVACAMLCDGTDRTTHIVYEQKPIAITSLAGTTTITATTAIPHNLQPSQWVSIRGVTSAAADIYNVTGKVQILTAPSSTTFTYTPFAAGTGTYAYSNGVVIGVSVLPDASKYHADLTTGGSTTTATFTRAQPSNINGWYAYGTNVGAGAQVQSGAGTTTLTFNLTGAGVPSGTLTFSKWPLPVTATYLSGGGAGVFNLTASASIPAYVQGWLATGTNMGVGGVVTGVSGAVVNTSIQQAGTPTGTITFSNPINNPLPVTATYSSGSGTSIVLAGATASHITGWFVSGTNIANGTTVTGGAGTTTINLSTATAGAPSGTITFYPPSTGVVMYYGTSAAPALSATGFLATGNPMQLAAQNVANGTVQTPLAAVAAAAAGTSVFVLAKRDMVGQYYDQHTMNYLSGVALGTQSITTFVDTNSFWATATGSGGGAGTTSFTLSAAGSPLHNGWFVSGTGIAAGTYATGGAGTTTITTNIPLTGAVSGAITFTAWSAQYLINRRIRVLSSTGVNQDVAITAVTPATGTLTCSITAALSGVSSYTILPTVIPGTGTNLCWQANSSVMAKSGRYQIRTRGGAQAGFDRLDLTTDKWNIQYTIPITETLSTGSMYAYDGQDRLYFTKDTTNRVYYLDLNQWTVHSAGMFPYVAGTAGIGNNMEVVETADGLKYLWVQRQLQVEAFRQLMFY